MNLQKSAVFCKDLCFGPGLSSLVCPLKRALIWLVLITTTDSNAILDAQNGRVLWVVHAVQKEPHIMIVQDGSRPLPLPRGYDGGLKIA